MVIVSYIRYTIWKIDTADGEILGASLPFPDNKAPLPLEPNPVPFHFREEDTVMTDLFLKKETLTSQVVEMIRNAIVRGELKPGTRLVEHELSERMGISRLPIREAIFSLEQSGLVTVIPYKGKFVTSFTNKQVDEFFSVRELLETHALKLLITRITKKEIAILEKTAKGIDFIDGTEPPDLARYDFSFHSKLCEYSGNDELHRTWNHLSSKIYTCLQMEHMRLTIEDLASMHSNIVECIKQKDFAQASQELQGHLDFGKTLVFRETGQEFLPKKKKQAV